VLDGVTIEASTEPPAGHILNTSVSDGLVRWYFASADIAKAAFQRERRTITLALDYPMTLNRFLVVFGSYYTMGSVQVTIRLYDKTDSLEIHYNTFFGRALSASPVDVSSTTKPGLCKEISVITADDTLLWPGSGLSVWWNQNGAEDPEDSLQATSSGRVTRMNSLDGVLSD